MPQRTIAAVLLALCGSACSRVDAAMEPKVEAAPVVLNVQKVVVAVAASVAGAPALLAPPVRTPDGSDARPFGSLAAALQAAPAGALLRIGEGAWRESLAITKPVVLLGRGADLTRIVPPEGTGIGIDVRADGVQLYGLAIEGAAVGLRFQGGKGQRLENVALRGQHIGGLVGRGAEITLVSDELTGIGGGRGGSGIDVAGGSLDARKLVLRGAGRRAVMISKATATLIDCEVSGSSLAALQVTDGADVRVVRGDFEGQGGAALYAGRAKLSIEGATVRHDEYAVMGSPGAVLSVVGGEMTDYRIAGVAMVKARGTVQGALIARGGLEGGISLTGSDLTLVDNRIQNPGPMGVHITESSITARGNTVTGARNDRTHDFGDAFYAIDSQLVIEQNVMRGNAGSGVSTLRTKVRIDRNGFIENGRSGVLLLDASKGSATGNLFERNALAGMELGERSRATLANNRFAGTTGLDIDTGCGKGTGVADLESGNTFAAGLRKRACVE